MMRSSLFCDIIQSSELQTFRDNLLVSSSKGKESKNIFLDYLTLEDQTDRLLPKRWQRTRSLRCVTCQKGDVLIYTAVEAWKHAGYWSLILISEQHWLNENRKWHRCVRQVTLSQLYHYHHWLDSPWWALAFLRSFAHLSLSRATFFRFLTSSILISWLTPSFHRIFGLPTLLTPSSLVLNIFF